VPRSARSCWLLRCGREQSLRDSEWWQLLWNLGSGRLDRCDLAQVPRLARSFSSASIGTVLLECLDWHGLAGVPRSARSCWSCGETYSLANRVTQTLSPEPFAKSAHHLLMTFTRCYCLETGTAISPAPITLPADEKFTDLHFNLAKTHEISSFWQFSVYFFWIFVWNAFCTHNFRHIFDFSIFFRNFYVKRFLFYVHSFVFVSRLFPVFLQNEPSNFDKPNMQIQDLPSEDTTSWSSQCGSNDVSVHTNRCNSQFRSILNHTFSQTISNISWETL